MSHSLNPGYKPGEWWVECQRCGLEYRQSKMKKEWTGYIVCDDCFETQHPQEFVRATEDKQNIESDIVNGPSQNDTTVTISWSTSNDIPDGTFGDP